MNTTAGAPDTDLVLRRYFLGLLVLTITVFLSNSLAFLTHPERVFDVYRNSPLIDQLHLAGFFGQLFAGSWLGVALVLDIRPGRRVVLLLWLAAIALYFAPMPAAKDDVWLTPLLALGVVLVAWLSRTLDRALARESH